MKDIGIWIDLRQALIIPGNGDENVRSIPSNVDESHPVGGYGSSDKHLPQDAVSTSKHTARKNQQIHAYFHEVISNIGNAENIYLIGPGETRKHFSKHITEHKNVNVTIAANEPCDSISQNQLRSKVRDFFTQYNKS